MNMRQDRHMQMVRGNGRNQFRQYAGQNVGNQNEYNAVQNNPNGNGNVVAARAKGNAIGNNGNQIRCYNCRGLGHLAWNCTIRPRRKDAAYLQTQLLIAQKEEAGIQLQAEEFGLMAAAADLIRLRNSGKQITTLNKEISNLNKQLSKEKSTVSSLLKEKKKLKSDFKLREDELLDKQIQLENKIKELDNILVKTDESLANTRTLNWKLRRLLRAVVSQDIMSIGAKSIVIDSSNLQTELDRYPKIVYVCVDSGLLQAYDRKPKALINFVCLFSLGLGAQSVSQYGQFWIQDLEVCFQKELLVLPKSVKR
ncbi:retrovirus-related pol polyprotein from transposon TNT 1-94 [Tanacetum coccineum]